MVVVVPSPKFVSGINKPNDSLKNTGHNNTNNNNTNNRNSNRNSITSSSGSNSSNNNNNNNNNNDNNNNNNNNLFLKKENDKQRTKEKGNEKDLADRGSFTRAQTTGRSSHLAGSLVSRSISPTPSNGVSKRGSQKKDSKKEVIKKSDSKKKNSKKKDSKKKDSTEGGEGKLASKQSPHADVRSTNRNVINPPRALSHPQGKASVLELPFAVRAHLANGGDKDTKIGFQESKREEMRHADLPYSPNPHKDAGGTRLVPTPAEDSTSMTTNTSPTPNNYYYGAGSSSIKSAVNTYSRGSSSSASSSTTRTQTPPRTRPELIADANANPDSSSSHTPQSVSGSTSSGTVYVKSRLALLAAKVRINICYLRMAQVYVLYACMVVVL